ncbi:cysteine-rich receptor-like protein kinase 42 [Citrus sinensis]|uniref:Cysteine-rich receptor-like protein kinase 42 n=1 Tax=Citrus sinensis TaxID=2711 RepID=A0ACB8MYX3_CITSI|nr:cysteine-rich receptor-like protein kinase 42 [Citrus sinensis]
MHFPHQWLFLFIIITIIIMFRLCLSDPRISEPTIFCSAKKSKTSNFVPAFVKEMEILSQLITANTHFATFNLNKTPHVPIYALAQCHLDLSHTDCLLCFAASRTKLPRCLPSLSAAIFFDGCFLRYDIYSFYQESVSPSLDDVKCSAENATVENENENDAVDGFVESVGYAVGNVSRIAVEKGGGFGAVKVMGVYALAQCWESLGRDGCRECLDKAGMRVRRSCRMRKEGRGFNAGCYLRYSTDKFFNHDDETGDDRSSRLGVMIAIVLSTTAFLMLSLFAAYAAYARSSKMKEDRNNLGLYATSMKKSCLSFKYETLEKATNYFNPSKKLGQGGAGSRLIFNTRQWVDEFFNEVNLISSIEHKNLVKLLGCSIEGPESLLVYEYVPNRSLDQFIFDKNKTKLLNWNKRFNIILGTAEGLAYLHGGSETRIIHRDIKTSNILLDKDFTPKIADFGLARCFAADRTHVSTAVAGTLGYMAPEYLVRGQLTEKADVYSFGILIIEIVCGRRSNAFSQDSASPLQRVWTLYRSNKLVEAVDPNLKDDFPAEQVCNVLQIGLLCTQAAAALRPSMAQAIMLLTNKVCEIPTPSQPPFLNSSVMEPGNSSRSCSANSFISNVAKRIEVSYSSSESSSTHSSDAHSRSRELTQK